MFAHFKTVTTEVEIQFEKQSLLPQFGSAFFSCKEGGVSTFVHIMNVKSLVFGDKFVSYLKSHQRCSAGIRPVKFFHTD